MKKILIVCVVFLLFLLSGCSSEPVLTPTAPPDTSVIPPDWIRPLGPDPLPQYDRPRQFGGYWKNVRSGCDVREIIIERASGNRARDLDRDGCMDDAPFVDPYTGNTITRQQAEIDHIYPPKKAWTEGAWMWPQHKREEFYQDQTNLLAVTAKVNKEKSDKGPAQWRPPASSGRCLYSTMYLDVAAKYGLLISPQESVALREMLATCPSG